ncbi:hypothetical protein ACTNDP_16075 [Paenibacillus barengoltzii]|uniref:hypothetical protein n=1 Tax=Paenibacillus barengoltzii TaxID=343517 RepID=UPI003F8CA1C7
MTRNAWMEKSKQEPTNREGAPEIESAARESELPKFTPEQFLELPLLSYLASQGDGLQSGTLGDTGYEPLFRWSESNVHLPSQVAGRFMPCSNKGGTTVFSSLTGEKAFLFCL